MDGARHEVVLLAVQRQITALLDETAAMTGPRDVLYRVALYEVRSAAEQALKALERLQV